MSRVLRELKDGELTLKDMSVMREADSAKVQHKMTRGTPRDYSLNHRVELRWDLNDEAIRDKMFEMRIDDKVVILDAEEMMRYLRWV